MSRYSDLTIRTKLRGMVLISALGLAVVFALSLQVLHKYRVSGPVYEQLTQRMALLSDMQPSVFDLAESYGLLYVLNQSLGAQQINEAMTQVTTVTQQTRDSIEEFKRATEHLRNSVDSINQEISQFKI